MNVHIVEDDWGVRDALVELVRGLGHSVAAYPEAESFIAAGLPGSGDLVLVDLALPGVRGEELLQQLRRLPGIALLCKPLAAEAIAALF